MLNLIDFLVMIVGLILYWRYIGKLEMIGKIMFAAGLLALLISQTVWLYHLRG